MKMKITVWDLAVILIIILAGAGCYFAAISGEAGGYAVIYLNGELYEKLDLAEDKTVSVNNGSVENVVAVKDGSARMESSNCKDGICVKQGDISKTGESIVCLPNKLTVSIYSSDVFFDGISR